jgi:serine/threonine protein kinase
MTTPASLDDCRELLLHVLQWISPEDWAKAVEAFGHDRAKTDWVTFVWSLSTIRSLRAGSELWLLTPFQIDRILNGKVSSLVLKPDADNTFILIDCVGKGGQGTLYKAAWRTIGTETIVALKQVYVPDPESLVAARFLREGKAICQSRPLMPDNTRYVVRGLAFFTDLPQIYLLAMEWLAGITIEDFMVKRLTKKGGTATDEHADANHDLLPIRKVCRLTLSIVKGLRVLHSDGVVHRDLKPANVMLVSTTGIPYHAVILDLGLIKLSNEQITASNVGMGTMYYSAPECFTAASQTDYRADIYSLCAILYFLLTGLPPAFELYMHARLAAPLNDLSDWCSGTASWPGRDILNVRQGLPSSLAHLIFQGLDFDRDNRPELAEIEQILIRIADAIDAARTLLESVRYLRSGISEVIRIAGADSHGANTATPLYSPVEQATAILEHINARRTKYKWPKNRDLQLLEEISLFSAARQKVINVCDGIDKVANDLSNFDYHFGNLILPRQRQELRTIIQAIQSTLSPAVCAEFMLADALRSLGERVPLRRNDT